MVVAYGTYGNDRKSSVGNLTEIGFRETCMETQE